MAKSTTTLTKKTTGFSSVSTLVNSSWERVKLTWKNLLILTAIIYGASFAGAVIIVTVLIGGGALSAATTGGDLESKLLSTLVTMAPVALLLITLFVLGMIVVGTVLGAAMLLAVAKADEKPAVGALIGQGKKYFVPMLLTSLLVGFLSLGGMFLFIIPGILIAIYMSFASYEVVLNDQKTMQAMKNSVAIISQNFGQLFKKYLVIIGIAIGLGIIESVFQDVLKDAPGLASFYSLLSMVVQAVFGWFTINYMYLLYTEARLQTDLKKSTSITWMWVVSIIGWLISLLLLMTVGAGLAALLKSDMLKNEIQKEMMKDGTFNTGTMSEDATMGSDGEPVMNADELINQYGSEMSPEDKEMLRAIMNAEAQK